MKKYTLIALRLAVAIILVQTLRYKFTAHPDSVLIFTKVGMEPIGRIMTGVAELIAAIMLLIPRTIWAGAGLTMALLGGAIMMHLTLIGIEVNGDNGLLFYTAIITFIMSAIILWSEKKNIPFINK